MSSTAAPTSAPTRTTAPVRRWAPRMWVGMCLGSWIRLLVRNRFRVAPRYWHKAVLITFATAFNSFFWAVEQLLFGWAIRRTKVHPQPLIILGHWRSGTTWLHELLGSDPQFNSPSTYQAISPNHFIVTKAWATKIFFWLMPAKRPMDEMPMGWDRPQEDEFALCNLGECSPYLTVAFPNEGPVFEEYLTLDIPPADAARWKRSLYGFLQKVTFADRRRLIIKSPPHTARVRTLLEMFPEARFVHLVRHPYALYSSTVHLWTRLYETHGLQVPNFNGLPEHVLRTLERMHERYQQDRDLIPPGRLVELRYEDLVQDPLGRLEDVYARLDLGDFGKVRPGIERFLSAAADYKTNRYSLTDDERQMVARRWAPYFEAYGYDE